jgi:hypothetical protein
MAARASADAAKRAIKLTGLTLLVLTLAACAAGSSEAQHAASGGDVSQFLLGIWHGVIAPVMLIVEVINRFAPHVLPWSVRFFETKATGVAYDVGFYLGLVGSPLLLGSRWSRR